MTGMSLYSAFCITSPLLLANALESFLKKRITQCFLIQKLKSSVVQTVNIVYLTELLKQSGLPCVLQAQRQFLTVF